MRIAIIGNGRFGGLLARMLEAHDVRMFDKGDQLELVDRELIILAVPIRVMQNVIKSMNKNLREDQILMDVASVKELPLQWMQKTRCRVIATHPLFGPDTQHEQRRIVVCTTLPPAVRLLFPKCSFLRAGAKEHDVAMAHSLALIHFLGDSLKEIVQETPLATNTHQRLLELVRIVRSDSTQLFEDMHIFNRHTKKVREQIIDRLCQTHQKIVHMEQNHENK